LQHCVGTSVVHFSVVMFFDFLLGDAGWAWPAEKDGHFDITVGLGWAAEGECLRLGLGLGSRLCFVLFFLAGIKGWARHGIGTGIGLRRCSGKGQGGLCADGQG